MPTSSIQSASDQINEAVETFLLNPKDFNLDLEALNLRIYLKGSAWAGVVDRPLAKFLIELDKMLTEELKKASIELPITEHGLIAIKVVDGSMDGVVQYAKDIMAEVRKLKPKDQIFVVAVIAISLGIPAASSVMEKLNEPRIAQTESQERVDLINAVANVVDADRTREIQKPIRALIGQMGKNDVIQLPDQSKPVAKEEAKALLSQRPSKPKPTSFHIDGSYIVEGLTTKKPGHWVISLKWGEVVFKAKMVLSTTEITELMESFQLAHQSGSNIAPDFQITAEFHNDGTIKLATVTGLGDRRKDALTIGDVFVALKQNVAAVSTQP